MSRPFVQPGPPLLPSPRERGMVILVDARGAPLDRIAFHGESERLMLPWRRILKAVVGSRCRGMILLHSHPSQDAMPSAADIHVTRRLVHMLLPLNVRLCEHVIVAGCRHFSFRSAGLL